MVWMVKRAKLGHSTTELDCEFLGIPCPRITQWKRWPFLIKENGEPLDIVNQYLIEGPIFKGHSEHTVITYANSLKDFFSAIEELKIDWFAVNMYDLLSYREAMRMPIDGYEDEDTELLPNTINLRITVINQFYKWAAKRFPYLFSNDNERNSQNIESVVPQIPRIRNIQKPPKILTIEDINKFIAHLHVPYNLMAKWQFHTGLRSGGVRTLTIKQIRKSQKTEAGSYKVLIREKGNKPRYVYAPPALISETEMYIKTTRKAIIAKTKNFIRRNNKTPSYLFINNLGNDISTDTYCKNFLKCSEESEISLHSHLLRAAYACIVYVILTYQSKNTNISPLLIVRDLLGHSSYTTTERYLSAIDLDIAVNEVSNLMNENFSIISNISIIEDILP